MADKSSQLVLEALTKAVADPSGVPLFSQKTGPGLFASSALARLAAQRCKEQDLVRVVRTESRGKSVQEVVTITPKGLEVLLRQANPRQVLEDLVRAVEARERQLGDLVAAARQTQLSLDGLKDLAGKVLDRVQSGGATDDALAGQIVLRLEEWQTAEGGKDCPLPTLFRLAAATSIGGFHDALRLLHEQSQVYLHPWTGPLYGLPEPPFALLVGHEVAYYASLRRG